MNHTTAFARIMIATLPAALFALSGCAGQAPQDGAEPLGTASEAWDQTCTQAAADATWTSTGNQTWNPTYGGTACYHAVVVDVDDLQVQNPNSANAGILMQWADTVPTNQADCEAAFVGAYLFNWNGSAWVWNGAAPVKAHGTWESFFGSAFCGTPEVLFTTSTTDSYGLSNGGTYRVEATARVADSSSAAEVKINVQTADGIQ